METTWRTPDGLAVFVFRRSPGALILAVLAVGEAGLGHKAGLEPGETEMFTWLAAMPLCHQVFEKMLHKQRGVESWRVEGQHWCCAQIFGKWCFLGEITSQARDLRWTVESFLQCGSGARS